MFFLSLGLCYRYSFYMTEAFDIDGHMGQELQCTSVPAYTDPHGKVYPDCAIGFDGAAIAAGDRFYYKDVSGSPAPSSVFKHQRFAEGVFEFHNVTRNVTTNVLRSSLERVLSQVSVNA